MSRARDAAIVGVLLAISPLAGATAGGELLTGEAR